MNEQFFEGEAVFDAADEKVGTLHEYNAREGYLVVQKGWLFPKDLFIPVSAVARNDADGVYLNLHKDDLGQHAYDEPPTGMSANDARPGTIEQQPYGDMTASGIAGVPSGSVATATDTAGAMGAMGGQVVDTGAVRTSVSTDDEIRVPVLEEELLASKRAQEVGRVRIHKEVLTEQQTVSAPLTHEEVFVRRVPAQGRYAGVAADAFTEGYVDITLMGEELIAAKRATIAEEVRVHKDVTVEQQEITDTVRRERVYVDGVEQLQATDAGAGVGRTGYGGAGNTTNS